MNADQLLQSLAPHLGLPELRFDENGCARLSVEAVPALNFERDASGTMHIYSVLGPLAQEGRQALYAQLLEANLFGAATGGASLAVDEGGEIILCRAVSAELTSARMFAALVDAFVATAQEWQGRLATEEPAT